MKRSIHLLICFIVLGLLASCKKDNNGNDDDRPAYYWSETTCTINGQLWGDCYPNVTLPGLNSARTSAQSFGNGFMIQATNLCNDVDHMDIANVYMRILFPLEEGNFVLNDFHQGGVQLLSGVPNYRDTIETDPMHTGELIIDKFEGKRISGRFQFQAYHKEKDSVYVIANGKFDDVFVYNLQ